MATTAPTDGHAVGVPSVVLPAQRGLFYGGRWHVAESGATVAVHSPSTGAKLCSISDAGVADVNAAVEDARRGYREWRLVAPLERARVMRAAAGVIRAHGRELAMLDAADGGNPYTDLLGDVAVAAGQMEYFAGLVTEMKGASIPMGPNALNFTLREPRGVVVRIIPFNHPFMFCAGKAAAPLAAGNAVIIKPPEQAPLSSLRLAELVGGLFPAGVFNVVPGGREVGATLSGHPGVAMVSLIGSPTTGRKVMRAASDTLKPVLFELGGKNALVAFPDADPDEVAAGAIAGMNFAWCGQSCGSTSRAFIHNTIYDAVVAHVAERVKAFRPGLPTDPATTMGAIVSEAQHARVLHYIATAEQEGARLVHGGRVPGDLALKDGWFIEPTVFADVTDGMTIAREEIFGPVLSLMRWRDEGELLDRVNALEYGLTCSIWTNDLNCAHRFAAAVEAGYIWVNETAKHFLGAPFGGYKQSGLGREECLDELLSFTQEKNVHIRLRGTTAVPLGREPSEQGA